MPAQERLRAPASVNPNHDLFHFTVEVGRVVTLLDAAKDNLLNRQWPPGRDAHEEFADGVDAFLEVCTAYLRRVRDEMQAADGWDEG